MTLTPHDELTHPPDDSAGWQENVYFIGMDPESRSGFLLHVAHLPALGLVEAIATVSIGDTLVSHIVEQPAEHCYAARGFDYEIVRPFDHVRVGYEGLGYPGPPLTAGSGSVPFGLRLEMSSPAAPISYNDLYEKVAAGSDHYEVGGTWTGELWCGTRRVSTTALMIRDHSWGPRDYRADQGWWTPLVFDDPPVFIAAASFLQSRRWAGTLAMSDANGVRQSKRTLDQPWVRPNGLPVVGGFDSASILADLPTGIETFQAAAVIQIPIAWRRLAASGLHHIGVATFATVQWGGRQGFVDLELAYPQDSPFTMAPERNEERA
ncbi:hypothetical protein ABT086_00225 [Streptomyces mirabilis]